MIVATVPCGGHYLVDTLAGLVVAAVSILVVRRVQRATGAQGWKHSAPPPAIARAKSPQEQAKS
jgi:membrane-associated phospholipid phosphatase